MKLWEVATQKYHHTLGFPEGVALPIPGTRLTYSLHALSEGQRDNLGKSQLPRVLPDVYTVVEMSAIDECPVKWVVRFALAGKPGWDIVLVINPTYHVSTVWLNRADDQHQTLKQNRYVRPEDRRPTRCSRGRTPARPSSDPSR